MLSHPLYLSTTIRKCFPAYEKKSAAIISKGYAGVGRGWGGAAGWDGVFLSQLMHAYLVLMMSSCMFGQNTA